MKRLAAYSLHYLRKILTLTGLSSRSFHSSPEAGHSFYANFSDRSDRTRHPELGCIGCIHWNSKVIMDVEVMGDCQVEGKPYVISYHDDLCYRWEGSYHD